MVSRRVAGRVLLVGDAAGYEDALTGEGISLAVKQAAAAVRLSSTTCPSSYESAWHRITRDYRLLTRGAGAGQHAAAGATRHRARVHAATCGVRAGGEYFGTVILAFLPTRRPTRARRQLSSML